MNPLLLLALGAGGYYFYDKSKKKKAAAATAPKYSPQQICTRLGELGPKWGEDPLTPEEMQDCLTNWPKLRQIMNPALVSQMEDCIMKPDVTQEEASACMQAISLTRKNPHYRW